DHLHGKRIQQDSCVKRKREHERKRQRHCSIENNNGHDINVGVVKPWQHRNEQFGNLRRQHQNQQNKKEYHLRPVTTNTSSKCERSTAGVICACPSNSRTRKLFTTPISKPDGKTPPTPDV